MPSPYGFILAVVESGARDAVEAYNRTAADPFCWIEMSIHAVN